MKKIYYKVISAALLMAFSGAPGLYAQNYGQSATTVGGAGLDRVPTSGLSQLISGQIAGLGMIETSSDPGNSSAIRFIRGRSTIHSSTPVVVVDGIIMQDYNIEYITADEIESITVLKDAAASAIYGLKGGAGVIAITTRKAREGDFKISAGADISVQSLGVKPQRLSAYEYATLRNQAWKNDGAMGNAPFSDADIASIRSGGNPHWGNNDWYGAFVRDFATMERAGMTLSGGSRRVRVWSNVNMMNQTSLFRQETDRYVTAPRRFWLNFRAKVDVDISDRINAFASISGNIRNDRLASQAYTNNDLYPAIFNLPPVLEAPLSPDGEVLTWVNVGNPLYGILNRSGYTKYASMYSATQVGLKADLGFITEGLSITGKVAFQSCNNRYNYALQDYRRFFYNTVSGAYEQLGNNIDTNLSNSVSGKFRYDTNYILYGDYARSFGKHDVRAHAFSYFISEQFDNVNASYPAVGLPYYSHNTGLFLGYSYGGRYSIGATMACVASDVFPEKNRYNLAPSVSASWTASNEAFMKDVAWIDALSLRASFGERLSDNFSVGDFRYLYADYITKQGHMNLLGNPDLEPECHRILNAGIDFRLFGQLGFTADIFRDSSVNMLIDKGGSIPAYQGIFVGNYMKVNEGAMRNQGWEIGLSWNRAFSGDFRGEVSAFWTHAENIVENAGELPYPGDNGTVKGFAYSHRVEGFPLGQQFGYIIDRSRNGGYISTDDDLAEYTPRYSEIGVPRKGDFIYKDLNGDGRVNQKDMAPIGNGSTPTDFATVKLGFGWKNFDLNLTFSGIMGYWGQVGYNTDLAANGIYNDLHLSAWTPERFSSGARIAAPALSYNYTSTSALPNDYSIVDRSFWRLDYASLSYTLPGEAYRKTGLHGVKLILSGSNLLTFSGLASKHIDPETGSMTALPVLRVFNLGVKLDL